MANDKGNQTTVRLSHHTQHIWHTSEVALSPKVAARVRLALGDGPYTNPAGHFGQAQKVIVIAAA